VFVEGDDELMQATSSGGATEYVTQLVPWSASPVFRVEEDPPACATSTTFRKPPTKQ